MTRSANNAKYLTKKHLLTALLAIILVVTGVFACTIASSAASGELNAPEMQSIELTDFGAQVSWSKVKSAVAYRVYRLRAGDSSWETIVKRTTARTFIDDSIQGGEKYYYKVKALAADSTDNSKRSGGKSVKVPFTSASSIAFSKDSRKMSVGSTYTLKVTVLPVYAEYKLTFSSDNKAVAKVSSKGKITAVSAGTAKITVKSGKIKDTFDVFVRLEKPEITLKRTNNFDFIKVKWNEVEGASAYRVYRYNPQKGSWKVLIKSTAKLSYTDKTPLNNADNIYGVKALFEGVEACNSYRAESEKLYIPETPYGAKIDSITKDGILYYWKKPAKSDGYEVWRYEADKDEFERIATINDRTQFTYLDSSFDRSLSTQKYKVRSFILNENGSKKYSTFSAVKTARKYGKLTISKEELYMRTDDVRQLRVFYGWGEPDDVTWKSTNRRVATVDENGRVTALKKGAVSIIAYCDSLNRVVSCSLTVDRDAPTVEYNAINEYTRKDSDGVWYSNTDKKTNEAVLMFAGDIMCTGAQQRFAQDNGLNYNACFDGVRDILETADFAVANLETITSDGWPYFSEETYIDSKANCNGPSTYIAAVCASGFDALVTSNNHNCDAGVRGIIDTNASLERYNMPYTGTFSSKSQQRFQIFEVNGIKVALLSYTTETTGFNEKEFELTQEERDVHLNIFSKERAEADFAAAREAGAEFVVCYMHWGVKNRAELTGAQVACSRQAAEAGADLITGGHCHLLQEFTYIETSDGRKVPCAFSLGDFLSSIQQVEGNRDSIILRLEISKNKKGNVVIDDISYIPCYNKTVHSGIYYYTLPVEPKLNGGYVLSHKETTLARIAAAVGEALKKYSA